MFLHHVLYKGKPQAVAAPLPLRRKKWSEYLVSDVGGYSGPVIGEGDSQPLSSLARPLLSRTHSGVQPPSDRGRLGSIEQQIREELTERGRVDRKITPGAIAGGERDPALLESRAVDLDNRA